MNRGRPWCASTARIRHAQSANETNSTGVRKGRQRRKGKRQEHQNLDVGSTASRFEPTYTSTMPLVCAVVGRIKRQRRGSDSSMMQWDGTEKQARSAWMRSEEHTSELQSLMRISYAAFCLKKKKK